MSKTMFGSLESQIEDSGWKKLEPYQDTNIYFDPETGSFWAHINGKDVKRPQLSQIKREIVRTGSPVRALEVSCKIAYVIPRNLTRPGTVGNKPGNSEVSFVDDKQETHTGMKLSSGIHSNYSSCFFLFDEEALNKFRALLDEKTTLERKWKDLFTTLRELTASELKVLQAEALAENGSEE